MAIVGTLKEVKDNENRVGLLPEKVKLLIEDGHSVLVQNGAGEGSGFSDDEYISVGAEMVLTPEPICEQCDILVKVKEPLPNEYHLLDLMKGKTLYTYLHLSGVDIALTNRLLANEITAIAYETIEDVEGGLPLLKPMSEVAGVLAVQYGAEFLQKKYGGRGKTLGMITGVNSSNVVVMGAGIVGKTSAKTAAGMGANVKLFDINQHALDLAEVEMRAYLGENLIQNVDFILSSKERLLDVLKEADVIIGAVLVAGAKAPKVITVEDLKVVPNGAVIIDVAIDQGGCIEGARCTSHTQPTYEIDGKIFCCIPNMPGQASRQSTMALNNATFFILRKLAQADSIVESLKADPRICRGLNTYKGKITYKAVAGDLNMEDKFEQVCPIV